MKDRKPDQWYVEPFVGGANLIDKVTGNRLGNDINEYLISLLIALRDGWIPPDEITELWYNKLKNNKNLYPKELVGYAGFNSFGAKFFGGYRRDLKGSLYHWQRHKNNCLKQAPNLKGIKFINLDYKEVQIPDKSIIYCDPPYSNSTEYENIINYGEYYNWCRKQKELGHNIFVSDYTAPSDFKCIWEKKVTVSVALKVKAKKGYERLFTL